MQFFHLPPTADVVTQLCQQVYTPTLTYSWNTWKKNPNASFVYILCIGSGASGSNGVSATVGGGGGGSGGQTQVMIPAFLVPDVLYYTVSAPSTGLSTGGRVIVSDLPFMTTLVGACVYAYAEGGNKSDAATGGTAGVVATAANMQAGVAGIVGLLAGQAGTDGGNAAAGTALTYPTTGLLVTGGAGGGGTTSTGGNITASAPRPLISGSTTTGVPGGNGVAYVSGAFLPSGGAGGRGGNASTTGSAGGNGGIGCGGGGGGCGTPVGEGGRGGPGLIMVAQW